MSQKITVKCPTCHHSFEVDLDKATPVNTIYRTSRDDAPPRRVDEYRFKCPQDGTYFIVPVTITED